MTKAHAIWFVISMSLSFGTNQLLRPSFDYDAFADGPTLASGELEASGIARGSIKLVDLRVIAADAETLLGGPVPVRQLLMRGALGEGQNETDLEMFVDFSREDGAPIDPASRSIDVLKGRPLKVLARAVAGDARSRIRLPGSDGPAFVKQGTLTIDEALELEAGVWRVRGELDIEIDQGGEVSSLFARLAGKIVWD